jgi:hypothetical protein
VFPLIGSEKHVLPVYVSSPDFEPDSEREGLVLQGEVESRGLLTDVGTNRMIFERSIGMFDALVAYLASRFNRTYLLARGLKTPPTELKCFDQDWYMGGVMKPSREVLKNYPIVETETRKSRLFANNDLYVLFIVDDDDSHTLDWLYRDLIDSSRFAIESENAVWCALAWDANELRGLSSLCEWIEKYKP